MVYITTYLTLLVNKAPAKSGTFTLLCYAMPHGKVDNMKKAPRQLSREAIEEFKVIYQEEFGEILSDDEVQEIAMRLLRFFGILNKAE